MRPVHPLVVSGLLIVSLCFGSLVSTIPGVVAPAEAAKKKPKPSQTKPAKTKPAKPLTPAQAAERYSEALASGDRVAAGQLDFACQYKMVAGSAAPLQSFPPSTDPIYAACQDQIVQAHHQVMETSQKGMDVMWPERGLVFFWKPLEEYGASFFVMDALGLSPPGGGLKLKVLDSKPLPGASFRLRDDKPVAGAQATLVKLQVTYKDPLTSPVSYAPGTYQWTNTVKRPRAALKSVTVQWVVLSGLKKAGFPGDVAVANLPVSDREGAKIPFVTKTSSYVEGSAAWFGPTDAPGMMVAAVARTRAFPDLRDRVALLNRVLIIDPEQREALTALTHDLYDTLMAAGMAAHAIPITERSLADRFTEFYWDIYSQTNRMDISLGMEVGGLSKPTAADYLYRMLPAMQTLARVYPEDLENRFRLGTAYRWNNDQMAAINTHDALVKAIPPERYAPRTRALLELAWSRIARVSWNRNFDDPIIGQAYKDAEEAYKFTDRPLDKFVAAYTMGYSLAFTPKRDNKAMLDLLTDAKRWYLDLEGATPQSWQYLLGNDTLKGVLEADPIFKPLLDSTSKQALSQP